MQKSNTQSITCHKRRHVAGVSEARDGRDFTVQCQSDISLRAQVLNNNRIYR